MVFEAIDNDLSSFQQGWLPKGYVFCSGKAKVLQPSVVQRLHLHRWHSKTVTLSQRYQLATGGDMSKVSCEIASGIQATSNNGRCQILFRGMIDSCASRVVILWLSLADWGTFPAASGSKRLTPTTSNFVEALMKNVVIPSIAASCFAKNLLKCFTPWDLDFGSQLWTFHEVLHCFPKQVRAKSWRSGEAQAQPAKDVLLSLHNMMIMIEILLNCFFFGGGTVVHASVWHETQKAHLNYVCNTVCRLCLYVLFPDMFWFLRVQYRFQFHYKRVISTGKEAQKLSATMSWSAMITAASTISCTSRTGMKCRKNQMVVQWYVWTKSCTWSIKITINCSVSTCFNHPNWYRTLFINLVVHTLGICTKKNDFFRQIAGNLEPFEPGGSCPNPGKHGCGMLWSCQLNHMLQRFAQRHPDPSIAAEILAREKIAAAGGWYKYM